MTEAKRPPIEDIDKKLNEYGGASWKFIFDAWPQVSEYIRGLESAAKQAREALRLFDRAECKACKERRRHDVMFCSEARRDSALKTLDAALGDTDE